MPFDPQYATALLLYDPVPLALGVLCLLAICTSAYLYRRVLSFRCENKALRAVFYDRPDVGVAEFRFGRLVERCNQTLERMFGMSREEIIGKRLPLPECRRPQWEELEAGLRKGLPFWNEETVRVRGDGSLFRAYISGIPIFGRDHGVVGHFGLITEQKWIESPEAEALRFAALADNSSDFLLLLDSGLRIIYANPTAAAMTGIDFDRIDGTDVLECFAEDNRDIAREYFESVLSSAISDEYSPRLKLRNRETGAETAVQFGIYPVFEVPDEGPAAIACVARDRSDELALAQKLLLKHKELQTVLENVPAGLATVDADGTAITSNKAFQSLMGYTDDEIRSTPFAHFVHPEDRKEGRPRFLRLVAGLVDRYEVIKRLIGKDGRVIHARTTAVRIHHDDGGFGYVVVIVVPIDEAPLAGKVVDML